MRLKVPPPINRFVTTALDKNQAETLFKLLMKYRPEDKKDKKERLKVCDAHGTGISSMVASCPGIAVLLC